MTQDASAQESMRLLRFLNNRRAVSSSEFNDGKGIRLLLQCLADQGAKILCSKHTVANLYASNLITIDDNNISLLQAGKKRLRRIEVAQNGDANGAFQAQHRILSKREVKLNGAVHVVDFNDNESPLARLKNRNDKNGSPWISEPAFIAGERLRLDFTKAQLMQKVTSSWEGNSGISGSRGISSQRTEISDVVIDARRRVENAFEFVGPELGGLLTDVCCFLKGLEAVERERCWPARSAKLMLRTGLDLLARHYGMASATSRHTGKVTHWGNEGFRPSIVEVQT